MSETEEESADDGRISIKFSGWWMVAMAALSPIWVTTGIAAFCAVVILFLAFVTVIGSAGLAILGPVIGGIELVGAIKTRMNRRKLAGRIEDALNPDGDETPQGQ